MASQKTITIKGREYDAVTGMPVTGEKKASHSEAAAVAPKKTAKTAHEQHPANAIHSTVQRSKTLVRRAAKKPEGPKKPLAQRRTAGRHMDIARSSKVSHFAAHPVTKTAAAAATASTKTISAPADKAAQTHPTAARALAKKTTPKPAAKPVTARQIKEGEIEKALAASKVKPAKEKKVYPKWMKRTLIIGGIVIVVLGALFIVYRTVPSISVGIAASQAGVNATYPQYVPDGYSLSQPVTYSDGQVVLKFTSNSNNNAYTITQTKSSWDSSAVVDNIVQPKVGDNYITTMEHGLTIYTYGNNASWVNGGILYTIDSNALLSGDQVRQIATSF